LNDGGRADGLDYPLYWNARGAVTGHLVSIEYSANNGLTWSAIASNQPSLSGVYFWDTPSYDSSILGRWRIVSQSDTNIWDITESIFGLRNSNLTFYVNDALVTGDVYTASAGHTTNSGISATNPKDTLAGILDAYDLEPGDTIYVDTGSYLISGDPITVGRFDAWDAMNALGPLASGTKSLNIIGSTNFASGGSRFRFFEMTRGMVVTQALGVSMRNLTMEMEPVGYGRLLSFFGSHYARWSG
jgi:hypothetical protein